MMRNLGVIFSLVILTLPFSCHPKSSQPMEEKLRNQSDPIVVSATLFPIYDIARQVGGTYVNVQLILPPGESPHTFNLTMRDKRNMDRSQKIFVVGQLLDDWVVSSINNPLKIIALDTGISLLSYDETGYGDGHHGEFDPHYWLDPRKGSKIAYNIADEYSKLAPENATYFREQANSFSKSVNDQFIALRHDSEPIRTKPFVTVHNGWSYFAEAFDLQHVGTFEPTSGENPTPRYLKDLQDLIRKNKVSVIFSEPQLSSGSINSFVLDNRLDIAILDPIGGINGIESYQDLLVYNIEALLRHLMED